MLCDNMELQLPNCSNCLRPNDRVRLGRFDDTVWIVMFGWYSYGGNRPVCGWHLINLENQQIKPLSLPDLDDIYSIESR